MLYVVKTLGTQMTPACAPNMSQKASWLNAYSSELYFSINSLFFSNPCLPFGMEMSFLDHCILEICNSVNLQEFHKQFTCFVSKKELWTCDLIPLNYYKSEDY